MCLNIGSFILSHPEHGWNTSLQGPSSLCGQASFLSEEGKWKLCSSDEFCYRGGIQPRHVLGPGSMEALLSTIIFVICLRCGCMTKALIIENISLFREQRVCVPMSICREGILSEVLKFSKLWSIMY